jgi:hypothetical protein
VRAFCKGARYFTPAKSLDQSRLAVTPSKLEAAVYPRLSVDQAVETQRVVVVNVTPWVSLVIEADEPLASLNDDRCQRSVDDGVMDYRERGSCR